MEQATRIKRVSEGIRTRGAFHQCKSHAPTVAVETVEAPRYPLGGPME